MKNYSLRQDNAEGTRVVNQNNYDVTNDMAGAECHLQEITVVH
jgi:hypothetical protein